MAASPDNRQTPIPRGLHVPGPTALHPEVAAAMAQPLISYRGPEARALLGRIAEGFCEYLGTERQPVLLTASGTGAMEATVANLLSPGDPVLGIGGGQFADRFLGVAEAFGLDVRSLDTPWGKAVGPERLRVALRAHPETRAVLLTHSETSTGVLHPLPELIRIVREEGDALVLVDAVSSLGAMPLEVDACDAVFTASQKAWGLPPGMAMVWTSERAEAAEREARSPRYYWSFARYREALARGSMPFTPAVPVLFAMEAGLRLMLREGRAAVARRHADAASAARGRLLDMGLRLVAAAESSTSTVTAAWLPAGVSWPDLSRVLRERHGVTLAGGLGQLQGRIVRLGHLGWVTPRDVHRAADALESCLGAPVSTPASRPAAAKLTD
jgi:aspartate aminotransferase-like enzyme